MRLVDEGHKFLDKRSEGELFGHRIYFHGEQKTYVAEAEEDCLVWHLNEEDFNALCDKHTVLREYFNSAVKTRVSTAVKMERPPTRLRDLLRRKPVLVDSESSIHETARLMSRARTMGSRPANPSGMAFPLGRATWETS